MEKQGVNIGLAGLPRQGGDEALSALRRQPRLPVTHVFDLCPHSAEEFAAGMFALAAPSLKMLLRECRGIVVVGCPWLGDLPVEWGIRQRLPLLTLGNLLVGLDLSRLRELSAEAESLVVPDLLHRWMPSTLRLRELTATSIGAVESLMIQCRLPSLEGPELISVLDWCINVVQSGVHAVRTDADSGEVRLQFRRMAQSGEPVRGELRIESGAADAVFPITSAVVHCRHGRVELLGKEELAWQTGGAVRREKLTNERSAWDVMFDLFGRRLVGGIVPVPDLSDVLSGARVREAILRSRETGKEVLVDAESW